MFEDEDQGGSFIPIFALAYKKYPDPEMRPYKELISQELREGLIIGAAAGIMRLHAILLHQRDTYLPDSDTFVHIEPKTGRNESCPCGSGEN